ncbi:hypothetical protein, partial [Paraclostridium sordellii]
GYDLTSFIEFILETIILGLDNIKDTQRLVTIMTNVKRKFDNEGVPYSNLTENLIKFIVTKDNFTIENFFKKNKSKYKRLGLTETEIKDDIDYALKRLIRFGVITNKYKLTEEYERDVDMNKMLITKWNDKLSKTEITYESTKPYISNGNIYMNLDNLKRLLTLTKPNYDTVELNIDNQIYDMSEVDNLMDINIIKYFLFNKNINLEGISKPPYEIIDIYDGINLVAIDISKCWVYNDYDGKISIIQYDGKDKETNRLFID